jgi:ATP-dependent Zn protease
MNILKAIAYHEAGHAIVSLDVGRKFKYITVTKNKDALGRIKTTIKGDSYNITLARVIKEVQILLSGFLAEEKSGFTHKIEMSIGANYDRHQATDFVLSHMDEQEAKPFLAWVELRTKKNLELRWPAVKKIAKALLAKKTLTYNEVLALILK